jgi:O-antigen ligase
VVGSFGSPNVAGSYFELLLAPCLCVLLIPVSKRFKLLSVAALAVASLSLLFTMSRGGWVSSAFSIGLVSIIALYKGWMPRPMFTLLVIAACLFIAVFFQALSERIAGDDNGSVEGRLPLIEISKSMIAENPLGVGGNNWDRVAERHAARARFRGEWYYFVHNKYLLLWAETGWLGLLAYLTFLGSTLACGWRAFKQNDRILSPLALGLSAAFAGQMIHMSMDVFNGRPQIQLLWLVAAVIVAISNILLSQDVDRSSPISVAAGLR